MGPVVEIYLLRHGIAVPTTPQGRDLDRPLTAQGIKGIQNVVMRAQASGFNPLSVVSSLYLRARQSAQLAAEMLAFDQPIPTSSRILPDSAPSDLWQEIREANSGSLLVVSHEPLLSTATAWMTNSTRVMIEFYPGTLARIDCDPVGPVPRGTFRWKLDPL